MTSAVGLADGCAGDDVTQLRNGPCAGLLAIRHERRADMHRAFLTLSAALIAFKFAARQFC
jgi:hypothetical protein